MRKSAGPLRELCALPRVLADIRCSLAVPGVLRADPANVILPTVRQRLRLDPCATYGIVAYGYVSVFALAPEHGVCEAARHLSAEVQPSEERQ